MSVGGLTMGEYLSHAVLKRETMSKDVNVGTLPNG